LDINKDKLDFTKNNIIEIVERDFKPICCVCGKPCKKDSFYIGGYLDWCHPKCAEYAETAVELYLKWLTLSHVGITNFAKHLLEVVEGSDS